MTDQLPSIVVPHLEYFNLVPICLSIVSDKDIVIGRTYVLMCRKGEFEDAQILPFEGGSCVSEAIDSLFEEFFVWIAEDDLPFEILIGERVHGIRWMTLNKRGWGGMIRVSAELTGG